MQLNITFIYPEEITGYLERRDEKARTNLRAENVTAFFLFFIKC